MERFIQGNLSDMDVITCWLASQTGDESFEKLVAKRREQKHEEIIQLEQDVKAIGISSEDFEKQGRIYLTSREYNISLVHAEEYLTWLEEKRNAKPKGAYAEIIKALETPKYTEQKEEVEKLSDDVEWVHAGTVKLESLKRKYRR